MFQFGLCAGTLMVRDSGYSKTLVMAWGGGGGGERERFRSQNGDLTKDEVPCVNLITPLVMG